MRFAGLIVVSLIALAAASPADAKAPVMIHVKAVKGRVLFSYRGKTLTDSNLEQICAASRRRKAEIEFQKEKMNNNDTMASLLKEANCLSATHASTGFTEIDRRSEPRPAAHRRAIPRHRAAARR